MMLCAIAVVLCVALSQAGELNFENDVLDRLQTYEVMSVGKYGQWNECKDKQFAGVLDTDVYGTDTENLAKYCAMYCRQTVESGTNFVNLDDRTDKGGSYACYCSVNCDSMCAGEVTFETYTEETDTTDYYGIAYYYNTYYYSSYWQFPYTDDSMFGRAMYYSYTGMYEGYYSYYYYYYGNQYGGVSLTLSNSDYSAYFESQSGTTVKTGSHWVMNCDGTTLMDFRNDKREDMGVDYLVVDDTGIDYSTATRANISDYTASTTKNAKCMPVNLFQYGSMSLQAYYTSSHVDNPESVGYGLPADTAQGVMDICNGFTSQSECEGYKLYSYGGCDDTGSTSSSNFGYSYYYDGTSVYHGDCTNAFDFGWYLQSTGYYGNTFVYYYYYYYSYVYPCDWTYNYDDDSADISTAMFGDYHLYAILDDFVYEERWELYADQE